MKLWAGRFQKETDTLVNDFNSSIGFDARLYKQDIQGSIAHAAMLGRQGIIEEHEAEKIINGLKTILSEIEGDGVEFSLDNEDIHMNIEAMLTQRIGDAGKRLHTARSRNDQVAVDVRMYLRHEIENTHHLLLELLKAVERVNERQKTILFDKIQKHYEGNVKGKHFGLWGLSFKPATDDMREAPSLVLIGQLLEAGATVKAFDPVAMEEAKRRLGDRIGYAANMYDALTDADAMIIVTEWQEFKVPKFTFIEKALKEKVIFDGRNIYNPEQMREFGYTYYGIGKNR